MTPVETVWSNPSGLPITRMGKPTSGGVSCRMIRKRFFCTPTFSSARSTTRSISPTTAPSTTRPVLRCTSIFVAPSTTCALVRIVPLSATKNPVPCSLSVSILTTAGRASFITPVDDLWTGTREARLGVVVEAAVRNGSVPSSVNRTIAGAALCVRAFYRFSALHAASSSLSAKS